MNQFFTVKTDIDDEQRSRIEAGDEPGEVLYGQPWFIWLPAPEGGHQAHPTETTLTPSAVNAIFDFPEDEPGEWFIDMQYFNMIFPD